jgi:chemotaxis protein methyltransferase CheR
MIYLRADRKISSMIIQDISDHNFRRFSKLIHENCGINLHDGKKELVRARLGKRMRQIGCNSFNKYFRIVKNDETGEELVKMLNAVSTNLTGFFREEQHFQFLKETAFPSYKKSGTRVLRIWSAGCSSGEEPYSLAIWLKDNLNGSLPVDTRIIATDINTTVLSQAARGVYPAKQLQKIPKYQLRKYFQRGIGKQEGYFRVKQEIKDLVEFRRQNLTAPFDFESRFDVIFCRNVMIYFNKEYREALIRKASACLRDGGYLMVGHAESLTGIKHKLTYIQPSVYRRLKN